MDLILLVYNSKCSLHNHVTNTTHLKEEHGIEIKLIDIITRYQNKKSDKNIRSIINGAIKKLG